MLPAESGGVPGATCLCPVATEAVQKALDFTPSSNKRLQFCSRSSRRETDRCCQAAGDGTRACGPRGASAGAPTSGMPQRTCVVVSCL